MSPLHFLLLLFKHFGVILENVRVNRGWHGDIEEKAKEISVYILLT